MVCCGACSSASWLPQPSGGEVCRAACSGFHKLLFQTQPLKLLLLYTHAPVPMEGLR